MNNISTNNSSLHADEMKKLGSFNAYYLDGDRFSPLTQGEKAVLQYNENCILLKILPYRDIEDLISEDNYTEERMVEYKKENSELLWVGDSGRYKDYGTWLQIKDPTKASFISVYTGQAPSISYQKESKKCGAELFYKLSDIGFKTSLDTKKRGSLIQVISTLAPLGLGIYFYRTGHRLFTYVAILISIGFLLVDVLSKKSLPKRIG